MDIALPKVDYQKAVNIIKALPSMDGGFDLFIDTVEFNPESAKTQENLQTLAHWVAMTLDIDINDPANLDRITELLSMFCFGLSIGQLSAED